MVVKQQEKRKVFTPLNIVLIISVISLACFAGYYVFNAHNSADAKNAITQTHDKIITHADSSKKEGSNSGSSSSKSSASNNKQNAKTAPASKDMISSNPGLLGKNNGGDEPDPNDDEDNGDKREKKLKKSGSMTGSSTEEDSEDSEDVE
jgi:hypothetical protein